MKRFSHFDIFIDISTIMLLLQWESLKLTSCHYRLKLWFVGFLFIAIYYQFARASFGKKLIGQHSIFTLTGLMAPFLCFTFTWTLFGSYWIVSSLITNPSCSRFVSLAALLCLLIIYYSVLNGIVRTIKEFIQWIRKWIGCEGRIQFVDQLKSIYRASEKFEDSDVMAFVESFSESLAKEPMESFEELFIRLNLTRKLSSKDPLSGSSCLICISDLKEKDSAVKLICGHVFHDKCVFLWFKRSPICPTCRDCVRASNLKALVRLNKA